ncbi:MAG: succinyl-diaminopimelate desuccinylase [Gammaproteobacteria bacterium]|nr:succinyl-diaminopimelate desuccinylase [Gammaproteobacteria bacterium]
MPETLALAKELMAIESITPVDGGCQQLIAERLNTMGFSIEHLQFGEVSNMWATLGDSGPLFAFTGHTDVVPPGPLKDWESHPFNPVERDGFLYGRGAADMKSSLAAMVVAAERFLSSHNLNFQLGFLITSDEEGEAINGIRKAMEIFKQREILIDYCLVGEPSSSKAIGDTIKIGRRGSLSGKLKVLGVEGHVAYPELASNPIHGAINSLGNLVAEHWDDGNSSFPPTSFQISNIHAGFGANNVIPESLEVDFNFRYSTEIDDASIKERVLKILDQGKPDYEIQWHLSGEPFLTNQSELIDLVSNSVKEETGETPIKSTAGGTSDGRFIAPTGAQVVELGPSNKTIHKINECIEIADLEKLTRIYENILTKLNAALR